MRELYLVNVVSPDEVVLLTETVVGENREEAIVNVDVKGACKKAGIEVRDCSLVITRLGSIKELE